MSAYLYGRTILRPRYQLQEWKVLVFPGEGEPVELAISCEEGEFGTELSKRGYDLTDPTLDFVRDRVK